jgi:hypothetical protein
MYASGPAPMVDAMRVILNGMNLSKERVKP